MQKLARLAVVVLSAVPFVACSSADEEEEVAASTATSALVTSDNGSITAEISLGSEDGQLSAEKAALRIAERPMRRLEPAGCATKSREGNTVHMVMKGCATRRGRTMDGTIDAVFEDDGAAVRVTVHGGADLTANGQPLAYDATATVTPSAAGRDIVWHARASGTTKRGRAFTRESDVSVAIDGAARCATINGASHGTVGGRELETTITDLYACEEGCPTRGEVVSSMHGPLKDRTMTVHFDGTPQAKVKGFKGRMFNLSLACEDGEAQ